MKVNFVIYIFTVLISVESVFGKSQFGLNKWKKSKSNISPNQLHSLVLDVKKKVKMSWMVDWRGKDVLFQVKNALTPDYKWFAFGFSRRGEFPRTDFCIYQRENDLVDTIVDAYSSEDGKRIIVDRQQDCTNIAKSITDGFAFRRKFDTCDEDDFPFHEGTMYIYWMRGKEPLSLADRAFMTPDIPEKDRGMSMAQILRADSITVKEKNVKNDDIIVNNVVIPTTDTTYWCKVKRLNDADTKKHIVEFEPVVDSEGFVHHMEVFHCATDPHVKIPLYEGDCNDMPDEVRVCAKVMALWAMGAERFTYPEDVGMPFGGRHFNPYIRLEIHYNNPDLVSGTVDNSGMRIHYVDTPRKYDAGIMELGLEYTDKMAIPPGIFGFPVSGYCIAECTDISLPDQGIIVFGSQLHTHTRGLRIMTRHFRGGEEIIELNRDDFYSHHFQEMRILRRRPRVLPGDALVTTCYYDTMGYENATLGGFSIQDEMCVNYIHYYPATELEVCKSSVSEKTLADYFDHMKTVEHQDIEERKGRASNYKSINWNEAYVDELFTMYTTEPLSMQCNRSDGHRFPGFDWEGAPITEVPILLPVPELTCSYKGKSLRDGQCDMLGDCIY